MTPPAITETLTSPAGQQADIVGVGFVCDEMAIDFGHYFTESYQSYLDYNLLTEQHVEQLQQLDHYFKERSGDRSPDFWEDLHLSTNPDWQIVREKASTMVAALGLQNWTIALERIEKHETTPQGERLLIQTTRTRLVRKNKE